LGLGSVVPGISFPPCRSWVGEGTLARLQRQSGTGETTSRDSLEFRNRPRGDHPKSEHRWVATSRPPRTLGPKRCPPPASFTAVCKSIPSRLGDRANRQSHKCRHGSRKSRFCLEIRRKRLAASVQRRTSNRNSAENRCSAVIWNCHRTANWVSKPQHSGPCRQWRPGRTINRRANKPRVESARFWQSGVPCSPNPKPCSTRTVSRCRRTKRVVTIHSHPWSRGPR